MFRDRFTPRRYSRYANSLVGEVAQAIRSGFVLSENLRFRTEVDSIFLTGELSCVGGIRIEVEERLRYVRGGWFVPRDTVELVYYRYNAVLHNQSTIFRYNSPHSDHNQFHHVHRYDVLGTGAEIKPPKPLREREVPTLRQVLSEAEDWYWKHLAGAGPGESTP